ncbi:hypothetical protein [Nitratireductor sp.]|uniref:hypothetical protein n=1 Tax=Nitratireductor sp. TaxID=1872084 RepID=UPI00260728AD|nr:hypothetical protein [Nitratireductor sp.]
MTATLNAARIAYDGEPVGPIHLYRSFLLRSPEDPVAFNLHGRLWGGFWQHLKSSKRHLISIDGEGIADLDFSAMFAMLAYWQSTGRLPERDPYDIPEFAGHRKGAKLALISLLSRRGSLKLLAPKLKAVLPDGWTARRVVEVMSERHAPIAYMFASDSGLALMAVESKILMAVLLDLAAKGIPALPMFDGINVKISDRAAALASMRRVSARILGVALPVAEKPVWHAQTLATAA